MMVEDKKTGVGPGWGWRFGSGLALPSWVGVGPTCSGLELVLPVGSALPSLGIGVGPSFSWGEGCNFLLAVGVAGSGWGWACDWPAFCGNNK